MKPLALIAALAGLITAPALTASVPLETREGYRVPKPGAVLEFPRAHASHPGFKIEWWYLTGHLFAGDGRRFGYQATFFRTALKPPGDAGPEKAAFGTSQLYLTHMALTDEEAGEFHFDQRLERGGWDAYARTARLDVRNGNWRLEASRPDVSIMQLRGSTGSDSLWELELLPRKPLIRFGMDGTSRKGPAPEARSYYLSFTRIETRGHVTIRGERVAVEGSSWMDHEIASNQLDENLTGWDWIAIQLRDGWEVKAYLLRRKDGSPSSFSALIWIDPEGGTHYREANEFTWDKSVTWTSLETKATYPIGPVIRTRHPVSGEAVTFRFLPLIESQELVLPGTTYWEGAGRIFSESGQEVGSAYLELVGYAGAIEGLR